MDVTATVWTLLPPIIAIALALITKEVYSSLMIGILSGALLYTGFHPLKAVETCRQPSTLSHRRATNISKSCCRDKAES